MTQPAASSPEMISPLATVRETHPITLESFTPQNIANILWSFAKLGTKAPRLFALMKDEIERRASFFNSQELANVVWAYATAHESAPTLFEVVADAFILKAQDANALNLATMAWAFAKAEVSHPALFQTIAQEFLSRRGRVRKLDTCSPQNIANCLWAFAKQRHYNAEFLLSTRRLVLELSGRMNPQEVSNTCWALATLGVQDTELFTNLGNEFLCRANEFTPQGISNVAWAVASQVNCPIAVTVLRTALLLAEERSWVLKEEELRALFQTCLALKYDLPTSLIPLLASLAPSPTHETPLQVQLSQRLTEAAIPYRKHVPVAGYTIDFTIETPRKRLAVTCAPFRHADAPPRSGSEMVRRKVLENLGFAVVEVNGRDVGEFVAEIGR